MTAGVVTAHLDEIQTLRLGVPGVPEWKPLRHELGVGAFGVNAWLAPKAGDQAIERHDEKVVEGGTNGHEELYVVLRGAARFTVGAEEIEAGAGALVFVGDPELTREAVATADDTVVLTIGAARGVAFEPSDWEQRWLRKLGIA